MSRRRWQLQRREASTFARVHQEHSMLRSKGGIFVLLSPHYNIQQYARQTKFCAVSTFFRRCCVLLVVSLCLCAAYVIHRHSMHVLCTFFKGGWGMGTHKVIPGAKSLSSAVAHTKTSDISHHRLAPYSHHFPFSRFFFFCLIFFPQDFTSIQKRFTSCRQC